MKHPASFPPWEVIAGLTVFLLLFAAGCTTKFYRKSADKQVYRILDVAHEKVFGTNAPFTIETLTSNRDPEDISPAELISGREQTGSRELSIEDALHLAVYNSRRYQTEKERLYLTALNLSGEKYNFQPHPFAGTALDYERASTGDRFGTARTRIGFSQLLATGGSVGVTLVNDLLRYYTGDPRKSAVTLISVNLFQPLLRGFGKHSPAVESLTQAERNVIYAIRTYSFFQDQYAITIVSDYMDLLAQQDIVRNRYTNYLNRIQSTRRLEARADRERAIDVDQGRQAQLSARNNYINAVATYLNALDQFKIELGIPISEKVHLREESLEELQAHGLMAVPIPKDLAYKLAVERQMQILNSIDRFEDAKRRIGVTANRLLPDFNLIADASLDSDRPTDYTSFDPDRIRAGAGVELNLPIDRLRERNNYRATLIAFEAELRNLSLTLDQLKDSIERGIRTLEQRRQTYEIQQGALAVANRRVFGASQLLEAGRGEMRDLVEALDAQVQAQIAVTQTLVSYQETLMLLFLQIGVIETDTPKFWLKNHLAAALDAEPEPPQDPFLQMDLVQPHEIF